MNIDERLDRLADRHEALAQSVELLRAAQEQTDAEFKEIAARFKETDAKFKEIAALFRETDGFINQLARIAARHEERLDRLDGGDR